MIYFDNAATSWPKPEATYRAVEHYLREVGANPGRSGHRLSIQAGRIVYEAREALAELFGIANPLRLAFTKNATEALNLALKGILQPGDHCITSSLEHNSVMRPLRALQERGVEVTVVGCSQEGYLEPRKVEEAFRPNTRLVALNHASNVVGTILPAGEVAELAHRKGVPLLVDAAQTAGAYAIDLEAMGIDLLAFSGHKSLYGLTGTGGLYVRDGCEPEPLLEGGTGSRSEEEWQPDFLPDMYESGTLNAAGIAGLGAGVQFVLREGVERIRRREEELTGLLLEGLRAIPRVRLYGPDKISQRVAVVSFNIEGLSPSEVAFLLDDEYSIMARPGLHCAPAAHRTLGTFPQGTVRFSLSYFNSESQVAEAVKAVKEVARKRA